MTLTPATAALARMEIEDRAAFAALLGAAVPDAWPPETLWDALAFFLQHLEAGPDRVGSGGWPGTVSPTRQRGERLLWSRVRGS